VTKLHRPSTLWLATVILWTVAYAGWTAGWMLEPMPFALERAMRRIPLCLFGMALCLGIGRVLDGRDGRGAARMVTTAALAVLAATVVHALLNELVFYVIAPRWGGPAWQHLPGVMMGDFWVYAAWVLLYFALAADAGRRDRDVRLAQASAQAIDAQHKLLVQQINPHFLFNAINTVYALVLESDGAGARRSLLALSSFLRRSLEADAALFVPLSRELESARDYLEIQAARFGERLQLVERVPEPLLARKVPSLILQPLIENCVKHGMQGREDEARVTITVSAGVEREQLILSVENDGAHAAAPAQRGVGLNHVARRLHLLYGDAARLDARPRGSGGFEARIGLPERS
jgi:hypothetical protein